MGDNEVTNLWFAIQFSPVDNLQAYDYARERLTLQLFELWRGGGAECDCDTDGISSWNRISYYTVHV